VITQPSWLSPLLVTAVILSTYSVGVRHGQARGEANLEVLKNRHAEQQLSAERDAHLGFLQQISRAQQSEELMFEYMARHAEQAKTRQERIPHVTTRYLPASSQTAQPVPHCVFTVGWLRDFNAALGVPSGLTGAADTEPAETPNGATRADAELLESGVTPADILAHAQDYGLWVRRLVGQLNAVLDLRSGTDHP
jgi:hypothetical protein